MVPARQKPISLNTRNRDIIDSHKKRFDGATGQKSDWGSFLATVTLLGLAAAGIYHLAKTTNRSPQSVDVQCCQCGGDFMLAVPQGTGRAIYITCPHCNEELVLDLGNSR
jgi:hypothetical protein